MKKSRSLAEAVYYVGVPLVQFLNRLARLRAFFRKLQSCERSLVLRAAMNTRLVTHTLTL